MDERGLALQHLRDLQLAEGGAKTRRCHMAQLIALEDVATIISRRRGCFFKRTSSGKFDRLSNLFRRIFSATFRGIFIVQYEFFDRAIVFVDNARRRILISMRFYLYMYPVVAFLDTVNANRELQF